MSATFKFFSRNLFRMAPLAFLPLVDTRPKALWPWGTNLKQNNIENRIFTSVLESNLPCEDRKDILQLTAIEGFAAAVYDGHGGWQVSELCSQILLNTLDKVLKQNKEKGKFTDVDDLITESIKQAFLEVENQYIQSARIAYGIGFGRAARAGACSLVCVVHNNKLYCGNAGDSMGIVVEQGKPMNYVQMNRFLNADNPEEQQRLKAQFPKEQDIYRCKRPDNTSCYVKGRLQPTRSIGDLRLKMKEFNNPKNYSNQFDFQSPLKDFSGSYITAEPQIKIVPLTKNHKWVILGSDGLWDQLGRQEVAEECKNTKVKDLGDKLVQKCLEKASQGSNLSVKEIKAKPQGKKRKIHDDITIIVVDLSGQVK